MAVELKDEVKKNPIYCMLKVEYKSATGYLDMPPRLNPF